ncbi:flagellar hook-associated protein FlgK [Paracoccaceae bacterium GXU_MW_L88]
MTIGSAINNALSGLNAYSRSASVIASNTANAMTEGYTKRRVELTPTQLGNHGAGVQVVDTTRQTNLQATTLRRASGGENEASQYEADKLATLADIFGDPGTSDGIVGALTTFGLAIASAEADPSSTVRLKQLQTASQDVVDQIQSAARTIQDLRTSADHDIGKAVSTSNTLIERIEKLNGDITSAHQRGLDALSLEDERQGHLDELGKLMEINVVRRDQDSVAIFTPGGAMLLDGKARKLNFTPTAVVTQEKTISGGQLSDVSVDGQPTALSSAELFTGGKIEAMLKIRDMRAVSVANNLDDLAADLATRFQADVADPTLGAADPALFTDNGLKFDSAHQPGIAARLTLNANVAPASGDIYKLRDGLGATAYGPAADATLLGAMSSAFSAVKVHAGATGQALSAVGFGEFLAAAAKQDQHISESNAAFSSVKFDRLREEELGLTAVNTDEETQKILEIENAYLANTKVFSIADEMLKNLLQI